MIWVSWRRQRAQLITLFGTLVLGAGVILLLRSNMIDAIDSSQLAQCVTRTIGECSAPDEAQKAFRTAWATPFQTAQLLIIGLPALIGVFIGAPLFALELEQGTHVLAFTQSVSRIRWMLSKLVVALLPALVVLVVFQYLVWWWLTAAGALGPRLNGPFHAINFGIDHVSPVGYALFAFALGTFLGAVSRRTLVAMTAGLAAFVVVRFALSGLVNGLVSPQRQELEPGVSPDVRQNGGLVIDSGWLDAAGQPVAASKAATVVQACKKQSDTQEAFVACLPQSGLTKSYTSYIPGTQAWQVHLVDASIFGGLAVLLLAGTAWVLRRQS